METQLYYTDPTDTGRYYRQASKEYIKLLAHTREVRIWFEKLCLESRGAEEREYSFSPHKRLLHLEDELATLVELVVEEEQFIKWL